MKRSKLFCRQILIWFIVLGTFACSNNDVKVAPEEIQKEATQKDTSLERKLSEYKSQGFKFYSNINEINLEGSDPVNDLILRTDRIYGIRHHDTCISVIEMYLSHEFRKDFLRVDNYYVATYNRRDGFVEEPPGTNIEVILPTYKVEFYYSVEEEGVKEYLNMIFFNYIDGKSAVYAHEELEDIDCMSILEESALSDTSRFRLCQSE